MTSSAPDGIEDRIKRMIVERCFLDVAPAAIQDDEVLIDRHDIDSLKLFEIVVGTEDEFGISVSDEEFTIDHFRTVRDIAECVRRHRMRPGPLAEHTESAGNSADE